jgi:acyl carrier protein
MRHKSSIDSDPEAVMDENAYAEIKQSITNFITNTFPMARVYTVDESDNLLEKGIVDSFGLLEVLGHIESTFKMRVADEDITEDNFRSISSISGYIARKTRS